MSSSGKKKIEIKKEPLYDPTRLLNVTEFKGGEIPRPHRLGSFKPQAPDLSLGSKSRPRGLFAPKVNIPRKKTSNIDDKLKGVMGDMIHLSKTPKREERKFKPNLPRERKIVHIAPPTQLRPTPTNLKIPDTIQVPKVEEKVQDVKMEDVYEEEEEDVFEGVKNPPIQLPLKKKKEESQNIFADNIQNLMSEDELFFIQLPSALPLKSKQIEDQRKLTANVDLEENIWTVPFKNTLTTLPPGYIGEMYVHKSGKTKLKLGDVLYDVLPGTNLSFLEHVAAISDDNKCFILGNVAKRILFTPDVENLLNQNK